MLTLYIYIYIDIFCRYILGGRARARVCVRILFPRNAIGYECLNICDLET